MDNSYTYSILLSNAFRILRNRAYSCLEKYELIPTHWSLIGIIYREANAVTVSEAAATLGVKLPLVTVMVDHLEAMGLVERTVNEADGRSKLLVPTTKGKAKVAQIEADISLSLAPIIDGITNAQLRTFQKVLQTIIDNDSL